MQTFATPANEATAPSRKPVVLCLDDDHGILDSLRRLLRREPFDLVTTADPVEALDRIHDSFVEVVLSDELMPHITGTAFLKIVEKLSPATARLLVSGHPHVAEGVKQQGGLVQHFIAKPWIDDDLRSLLRGLVKGPTRRRARVRDARARDATAFMVERPVLVECAGRKAGPLAAKLLALLRHSRIEGRDVVAILDGLEKLAEDPGILLAELASAVDTSGARLHLVDGSGIVREFFRSAELFDPRLKGYGPATDPEAPKSIVLVDPQGPRRVFLKLLFAALGCPCRAVATADEARAAIDEVVPDRVFIELTEAGDAEIGLIRDLARTGRRTEITPLLGVSRAWSPTIARKWNLVRPLVRPYHFVDLQDALK